MKVTAVTPFIVDPGYGKNWLFSWWEYGGALVAIERHISKGIYTCGVLPECPEC